MPLRDFQRSRVFKAERAVWEQAARSPLSSTQCQTLVSEVAQAYDLPPILVSCPPEATRLDLRGSDLTVPPFAQNPLALLHVLQHHRTSRVFPAHGAEFAAGLLELLGHFAPALEEPLRDAFQDNRVFTNPLERARRSRRTVMDAALWKATRPDLLVLRIAVADPPELLEGPLVRLEPEARPEYFVLGSERFPFSRLRYAEVITAG